MLGKTSLQQTPLTFGVSIACEHLFVSFLEMVLQMPSRRLWEVCVDLLTGKMGKVVFLCKFSLLQVAQSKSFAAVPLFIMIGL